MEKKYSVLKKDSNIVLSAELSVLIVAHALVIDNSDKSVYLQCKFQNISNRKMTALYLSAVCELPDKTKLESPLKYSYLDLRAVPGDFFGDHVLIPLPDQNVRQYYLTIEKIIFDDTEIVQNSGSPFSPIEPAPPLFSLGELQAQYKREAPPVLWKNVLVERDAYWICACGQINLKKTKICVACHNDPSEHKQKYSADNLRNHLNAYREEQAKQKARGKKLRKRVLIIASIAVLCGISLTVFLRSDFYHYQVATSYLNKQDYDEARFRFNQIIDYKDSREKKTYAENGITYQKGLGLFESGKYEEAIDCLASIVAFEDARQYINESYYQIGAALMEEGNYKKALSTYKMILGHKDVSEKIAFAEGEILKEAEKKHERFRYEEALALLQLIPVDEHTTALMDKCYEGLDNIKYNEVSQLILKKDYELALELMGEIPNHPRIEYLSERMKSSCYEDAVDEAAKGAIKNAKELFDYIRDYENTNEYLNVIEQIEAEKWIGTYEYEQSGKTITLTIGYMLNEDLVPAYFANYSTYNNTRYRFFDIQLINESTLVICDTLDNSITTKVSEIKDLTKDALKRFEKDKIELHKNGSHYTLTVRYRNPNTANIHTNEYDCVRQK